MEMTPPQMSSEEFRRHGHDTIDWIARYMDHIRDYPVLASVKPGELIDALPQAAPETGEPMAAILRDFEKHVVPAATHWNHPRFHAFFSVSGSPPGVIAETLIAALNMNGMLWRSSPAVTELEMTTLAWLRQWLGLPEDFFGVIYDTASTSTLHAVCAARDWAAPDSRRAGTPPGLVIYCSDQAHSSVEKAAMTAGIGLDNVRKVPSDAEYRMRPDLLGAMIQEDIVAGKRPFCVVATVGTTPSAAIDPVPEIVPICQRHAVWLHIDGAYGGCAAISDRHREVLAACDRAQSIVVNPHKWLLTQIDLSVLYTNRPDALRNAFSLVPEYLRTADDPRSVNLMDYGFQLGRRFRALKLWFVMRYYGHQGLAAIIDNHCEWAREVAGEISADPRFELAAPVLLSLVCFRMKASDEANRALLDAINQSGFAFLSHTVLNGKFVLRLAIGNYQTTRQDLADVWRRIRELASSLAAPAA